MASNYFWSNNTSRIDFMKCTHYTHIIHDNRFLVNHFNNRIFWIAHYYFDLKRFLPCEKLLFVYLIGYESF